MRRTPSWSSPAAVPDDPPGGGGVEAPTAADRDAVVALLGRSPTSPYAIAVRCPHGRPAVIRNAPVDRAGRPFPTRDWLVCRALVAAVSRLESAGGVRALEEDPGARDALAAAQARHAALHGGHAVAGAGDPRRVKCLHAHLAFALATGDEAIAGWILVRAAAGYPERCCLDDRQLAAHATANWPTANPGSG